MTESVSMLLGHGITCIDANYIRHGLACLYLMEQDGECAIIETGTAHSVANLRQVMEACGLVPEQVRYIIPTHVHLDHAGGAGALMDLFPQAQLIIHPRGAQHMADPERLIASAQSVYGKQRFRQLYGQILPVAEQRILSVNDGQKMDLGTRQLEFRHTRGHANHHFCVWDEASRGWFSGDMFGVSYPWFRFDAGDFLVPTTTPTQFDPDAYLTSVELLGSYHPERIYLTHYGELGYSSEVAALLLKQVAYYRHIAPAHAGDRVALERSICEYSLQLLQSFDPEAPMEQLRELLDFDMNLNAQGLDVWLQRRSAN